MQVTMSIPSSHKKVQTGTTKQTHLISPNKPHTQPLNSPIIKLKPDHLPPAPPNK